MPARPSARSRPRPLSAPPAQRHAAPGTAPARAPGPPVEPTSRTVPSRRRRAAGPRTGEGAAGTVWRGSPGRAATPDPVGEVIRWASFGCLLVPVALVLSGTPVVAAVSAALGLAAVTAVCRLLLRRAERGPAGRRGARTARTGRRGSVRPPRD
ncbi:hypothetical protein ACFVIM_30675 [Streptomyces sp. NPDC057638]|uniref:hypothetical protein n=1 Tax=Streptomyces sp. NPDC057638 TaxID=3346190 RepID=UPI003673E660